MTAPETGSMVDYVALGRAVDAWSEFFADNGYADTFEVVRCAKRCGMPGSETQPLAWSARRLATYRAMMEKG